MDVFANVLSGVWVAIAGDFIYLLLSYVLAKYLSATFTWIIIESIKNFVQGATLYAVWNQRDTVLAISLVSFIMGFIALSVRVAEQFVNNLETYIWGGPMAVIYKSMSEGVTMVQGVSSYRTWVDIAEIASDFTWGAVALAHYFGVI